MKFEVPSIGSMIHTGIWIAVGAFSNERPYRDPGVGEAITLKSDKSDPELIEKAGTTSFDDPCRGSQRFCRQSRHKLANHKII